jgi:uncharacterized protein with FMN-binding domain
VTTPTTTAAVTGLGLLAVALSGCATAAAEPVATGGGTTAARPSATAFHDGTYSEIGRYSSPGGPSAVAVTVTLARSVVTAVKVVPKAENPTAAGYEQQFASGVPGKVIGRKLSELDVTTVSGSSLTSQGFDAAIAAIERKAQA